MKDDLPSRPVSAPINTDRARHQSLVSDFHSSADREFSVRHGHDCNSKRPVWVKTSPAAKIEQAYL